MNKLLRSKSLLLVLLTILCLAGYTNATDYYVATNGSNSNPGTLSQPWQTVQYAANNVSAGDVVYIRAGTYDAWDVTTSGTSNNPITFRNYPSELPVVNGSNFTNGGIDIRASYIIIDGIRIYNVSGDGIHIEGSVLGVSNPITDITIRNCQIDGTSNAGIYCAGLIMGSTIPVNEYRVFNVLIEDNDITNTNYPNGGNECISLGGGTNGFIIRNNYVHDSEQYGIDAKFGAINGEIYGNVVTGMEKHGIYIDTNSRTCENIDIYNNFVSDCGANGITLARESRREPEVPNMRDIRIFDNVITGCLRGILVYKLSDDVDSGSGDYEDIIIVNNTLHDNNRSTDAQSIKVYNISDVDNHLGWIIANNLISENNSPLFVNSSGSDWIITNNITVATDAPYVDADSLDFHLVSGSVAEDTASATYLQKNTDFDGVNRGTPPDAGAFEFVSGGATVPDAPSSLSATAVSSSQINLSWTDNADDEDGFKVERKEGAGSYSQIATLGENVTTYNNTNLSASTTYTYRVVAYNTAGNSSYSNEANATTQSAGGTLPSPWSNQDIGAVGATGSASYSSGVFTVDGSGADVWNTADELHYVYQQLSGDVEIIARIASQEDTHIWSKSGVMIRESLSAGSKQAHMFMTPNYGFNFQWRTQTDSTSSGSTGGTTSADPNNWVRLVRSGSSISAYSSSDGTSWTQVGSTVTISMNTAVYVGLSVCSHSDGNLCTTEFDNVDVIVAPEAPSSLSATGVSSSQINLSWTDNSNDETGFKVERKTTGSFAQIAALGSNITSFSDTGLTASTIYTYRVLSYNSAGNSSYSNEASDTSEAIPALFSDDFEDGNDNGWTQETGSWSVVTDEGSKRYEQGTYTTAEYRTSTGNTSWDDYTFEVDVQPLSFDGNSAIFINFRYSDNSNTYRAVIHGYNQLRLQKKVSGALTELANESYTFNTGTIYTIRLEAVGTNLKVYVNDNLEISETDASHSSGEIALATWKTTANFDNVLVQSILAKKSAVDQQTGIQEIATEYSLGSYPNPFNPSTKIQFGIPAAGEGKIVELKVYDILGRLITTLIENNMSSGIHEIDFNASGLASGMYIFRLQCGNNVVTHRALLMK